MRFGAETFHKVGITVTEIRQRFSSLIAMGVELTVIAQKQMDLYAAFEAEQALLIDYAAGCAYRPTLAHSTRKAIVGVTECFSDPLPEHFLLIFS